MRQLFGHPGFGRFWLAQMCSITASSLTSFAFPILAYQLTGSPAATSVVTTAAVLPYVLFGLVAGAISDRGNRKRLMVSMDLLCAAALLTIPLAQHFGVLGWAQVITVALVTATAFVWADCAQLGGLATLVGTDDIVVANSVIYSGRNVVSAVVPPLAGAAAAMWGPAQVVSGGVLGYLLSAMAIATIAHCLLLAPEPLPGAAEDAGSITARVARDVREGVGFVMRHPVIRPLTLLGFGLSLSGGAVLGLVVVYAVRALGIPEQGWRIGLLFAVTSVGGLLGSALVGVLSERRDAARVSLVAYTSNLACLLLVVWAPTYWVALPVLLLWEATYSLAVVNGIATRAKLTPLHLQSRANAAGRVIAWAGQPLGALVAGLVAERLNIRATLLLMGAGIAVTVVGGWRSPLRLGIPAATALAERLDDSTAPAMP